MFAVHQGQLALRTFAYSINALSGQIVVLPPYRHGDHGPTGGSTQVVATEVGFGIIPLFRSTSHPEMSMAEIAADCGYSTQSLFNRHFRRLTGQTPGQLRRAHPAAR